MITNIDKRCTAKGTTSTELTLNHVPAEAKSTSPTQKGDTGTYTANGDTPNAYDVGFNENYPHYPRVQVLTWQGRIPRLRRGSLGPGHLLYHDPGHWVPAGVGAAQSFTNARAYPEFHVVRATWQVLTVALERAVVEELRVPGGPVVVDDRFYCHGAAALVSVELEIPAVTLGTSSINSHVPLEGHLQCRVAFQLVEGTFLKHTKFGTKILHSISL